MRRLWRESSFGGVICRTALKYNTMNKGMCSPMSDKDFFALLTSNGTNPELVKIAVKYYPELEIFVKKD